MVVTLRDANGHLQFDLDHDGRGGIALVKIRRDAMLYQKETIFKPKKGLEITASEREDSCLAKIAKKYRDQPQFVAELTEHIKARQLTRSGKYKTYKGALNFVRRTKAS